MKCDFRKCVLLALLLLVTCCLEANSKGGRGGGGSRGGGSRGSSSRGSSSRGSSTDYSRRNRPSNPPPPPVYNPPPPQPKYQPPAVKPSAPEAPRYQPPVNQQPPYNPNYNAPGAQNPAKPPPYSPQERPPPYAPAGAPPPYSPGSSNTYGSQHQPPAGAPPAYSQHPGQAPPYPVQPGAYPRQPGAPYPQQPGGAPYPVQPGAYPRQPGAPYPQQPGSAPYPQQPGAYPRQPGAAYPQQPGAYPRQPGAPYQQQPGAYPRQPGFNYQPYPQQPGMSPHQLGSNVWRPNAGRPAPAFMGSGGLPTGTNMYSKPYKKKGFLGTIFSMGSGHGGMKKQKYYGNHMSPYGMASMGKSGMNPAMYAMLPYMAARHSSSMFKPRFRMPLFLPIMMPHSHYGYGGYGGYGYGHRSHYYDVYNDNYVGRCNRPLTPEHGSIHCVSTENEVNCEAKCKEGYMFPDNTTRKENKCWHVTGVWRPSKNFQACQPACNNTCHNGGRCSSPGVCSCPPEYRGNLCQYHYLECDIRKLAGRNVGWACSHTKNETVCTVRCRPPATEFATPTVEKYHCTPDGNWTPNAIPDCIGEMKKTCTEKPEAGPCFAYVYPVWYYDGESGTCKKFVYGGCQGNSNRYDTGEECMENCKGEGPKKNEETTKTDEEATTILSTKK